MSIQIPDDAIEAALTAWGGCPAGMSPKGQMTNILEAAAPYMQQTVTTPGELMSLPVGSVVLSERFGKQGGAPIALQKAKGALWIPIGRSSDTHSSYILPATVLHVGGGE